MFSSLVVVGFHRRPWAFNEEIVVRAIFESRLPVISSVGHETDVTWQILLQISAATPTAAAELANTCDQVGWLFIIKSRKADVTTKVATKPSATTRTDRQVIALDLSG